MQLVAARTPGGVRRFSTAILVKGTVGAAVPLTSAWEWLNQELETFKGNLFAHQVTVQSQRCRAQSAESSWWRLDRLRMREVDVQAVKLKLNPDVWVAELL